MAAALRSVVLHVKSIDRAATFWRAECEVDAGVSRLIDLGAVRADWTYPHEADVVLSDTVGNLFCVVTK